MRSSSSVAALQKKVERQAFLLFHWCISKTLKKSDTLRPVFIMRSQDFNFFHSKKLIEPHSGLIDTTVFQSSSFVVVAAAECCR
jgi:hypothetical protein